MAQIAELGKQPTIIWEKLPNDFVLPDEPVENIYQPLLAAALTEALDLAGLIKREMLIASNLGICAKINDRTVVKAPDWFYVPRVLPVAEGVVRRSYTPHAEGDIPEIVMEFLSETETGEYSIRPTYPYGKMWFYERILRVPIYVLFEPSAGTLEVRKLNSEGRYDVEFSDSQGRYYISAFNLSLGVWRGRRLEHNTHWLRWWDESGNLLLWGSEKIEQERQRTEQERQRAELAEAKIARLQARLRKAGITEEE